MFVSIGTGKRGRGTDHIKAKGWRSVIGYDENKWTRAGQHLMDKIEGCEVTHQYMLHEHLSKRQVNASNYYRLNVEIGVGEFGMNEWNRLTDISTNTRMYLSRQEVQSMNLSASAKLGKIHKAKMRWERSAKQNYESVRNSWQESVCDYEAPPPSNPMAVELPASEGLSEPRPASQHTAPPHHVAPHQPPAYQPSPLQTYQHKASDADKYPIVVPNEPRVSTDEYRPSTDNSHSNVPLRQSFERPGYSDGQVGQPRVSEDSQHRPVNAPPLPPKTPIGWRHPGTLTRPPVGIMLPYPDTDGPPPPVNMARKPG